MATLQDLVNEVAAETTQIGVVSAFIAALQARIGAIPGLTAEQQTQIDAIFTGMEANKAALATAMEPRVVTPAPIVTP